MHSIAAAIARHARDRPAAPALTCGPITRTWGELDRLTNRLARAYQDLGVVQDDLVTIALPNSTAFVEAALAVWKLGSTPQPVSARLPGREFAEIVELANSRLVVGAEGVDFPGRATVPAGFEPPLSIPDTALPDRTASHWKAPTSGGSTGRPKIILAQEPGAFDPEELPMGVPAGSTVMIPGVLYHNAPFSITCRALFLGNHVIHFPRFVPEEVLRAIDSDRPEFLYMVPTMMGRIWKLPEEVREATDMSCLKIVLHMAAPCPPWLKEAWIDWVGPEVLCELYAGTEIQSVTWITGTEYRAKPGSVGKPIIGEMKVFREDGTPADPGEVGEIYMRAEGGPGSTYRYLGSEVRRLPGTEWESLGDMGSIDEDGYVFLADRRKDMILRGGANIYPAEVEAALEEHPAIRSCAVIGVADDDLGQRVRAIVDVLEQVEESALRAHMADRLVAYKCPDSYVFVDEPVRDDAGKVRRSVLQA